MTAGLEYGAHLPLLDLGGRRPSPREYARVADELGFRHLCANDHLLFARPWLDGLAALASVAEEPTALRLTTSVALPVIRGPVQLAKSLAAIDVLSGGRLVAGVGPGSSRDDYAAAGIPFEERRARFSESLVVLRALLEGRDHIDGTFYPTRGIRLAPPPVQRPAPPIWVASWGAPSGLARVAAHGDGWLASAYNTTPERFRDDLARIHSLRGGGEGFANGLATAWLCVTDDRAGADRVLRDVLSPLVRRPVEELAELSLPIGPPEVCAERLRAFADAGAERVFVWPLRDELRQLERFRAEVAPLIGA